MKEILLSRKLKYRKYYKQYKAIVDDEDFEYLNQWNWSVFMRKRGQGIQAQRTTYDRETLPMHRVIIKAKAGQLVDHINRNPLDNRKENLRVCDYAENSRNRGKQRDNTSGYKGVFRSSSGKKWVAKIGYKGKHLHIGTFIEKTDAAKAYNERAKELYGEFACLNPIS